MSKLTSILLSVLLATTFVAAQENDGESAPSAAPDEVTEAQEQQTGDEQEAEVAEDADLDQATYEEDDDVFVPTEEIPADEPIPFPTDI